MRAARVAALRLGFVWSVSLASLAVAADHGGTTAPPIADPPAPVSADPIDLALPPVPDVVVEIAPPATPTAPATATAEIPNPDGAVTSISPIVDMDQAFTLPDLPEVSVTLTVEDRLRIAIVQRLGEADKRIRLPRREREALTAFYAANDYKPVWISDSAWTPAAKAVMQRLRAADEDGLDPADYPVPSVAKESSPEAWADAEVMLSASAILYARDARGGRIDPSRLSNMITLKLDLPEPSEVLTRLTAAENAGEALEAYNPPHEGYNALKSRLAQLRTKISAHPMTNVPAGPTLKVGMSDPRVPLIRARFDLGPAAGDPTAYDERVASAVAAFQKEKGLPANGVLTSRTVAALGGSSPARLEGDLIANMERWRWLPKDLGQRHILVNVPEFRLRLVENGEAIHEARVIVGKSETPTPIFSDEMEHVIVNPSWNVPPSILKKEFLPGLAADPLYAERRGYKVTRRGNQISIRQPPGERNALGYVKFIFPNQHSVYLHDTPSRGLFSAQRRAFSHGCVRVDKPFQLAEEILGTATWPSQKLRSLIGKGERYIKLRETLPVHLAYFTLAVDEEGHLKSFDDLYGFHKKVRMALRLGG